MRASRIATSASVAGSHGCIGHLPLPPANNLQAPPRPTPPATTTAAPALASRSMSATPSSGSRLGKSAILAVLLAATVVLVSDRPAAAAPCDLPPHGAVVESGWPQARYDL